jgi:hypothetical protein
MIAACADGDETPLSGNLKKDAAWFLMLAGRIPDTARNFSVRADIASRDFDINEDVLSSLRSAGLPTVRRNGISFYDRNDLKNAALYFNPRSRQRQVLSWWVRALERSVGDSASYRVSYVIGCAGGGHQGSCKYSFLVKDGRRQVVTGSDAEPAERAVMIFTLQRDWPELPAEAAEIIDEVSNIRFLWIPPSLREDSEFVLAHGIGPCESISRIIVAKALARGLRARLSRGLVLTPPVAANHFWAEFQVDGRWVPVDPMMIDLMLALDLLAPKRWSRYKSFGGILGRLGAGERPLAPLALHNGVAARPRLMVRRVGAVTVDHSTAT